MDDAIGLQGIEVWLYPSRDFGGPLSFIVGENHALSIVLDDDFCPILRKKLPDCGAARAGSRQLRPAA